jgi:hypothetical protein
MLALAAAWRARRGDAFARALAAWLLAECTIAPFVSASASVRRVLGALVVLAVVFARQAGARVTREPARRGDVVATAVLAVLLGLAFWGVGVDSALAERRVVAALRAAARESGARRLVVVGSHWGGAQDAARRAGVPRIGMGRDSLRAGDRVALLFDARPRRAVLDPARLVLEDSVPFRHVLPVTTRRSYYDGRLALRRVDPSWVGAWLWRVTADGPALRALP